jgi:hypothetical protein
MQTFSLERFGGIMNEVSPLIVAILAWVICAVITVSFLHGKLKPHGLFAAVILSPLMVFIIFVHGVFSLTLEVSSILDQAPQEAKPDLEAVKKLEEAHKIQEETQRREDVLNKARSTWRQ